MLKKLIVSTCIFATLFTTVVYAVDYSYKTSIDNEGSHKYKAVRLTPEICNKVRKDMADLVIYDKDNEPVPYFINSFVESDNESKKTYDMKLINSYVKDEYLYYDYTLKKQQDGDVLATSMEVQTGEEGFAKKVEIFGGYDNVNWEKVQDDILYSVDGNKKLDVTFNNAKKYTYYRFKISNNMDKISFSSAVLKYNKTVQKKEYFINSIAPEFTTEERGQ